MKYLYCGLLILCLLLGACWLSGREIGRRSEAVALPLENAVSALRAGDAAQGRQLLRRSAAEWERHEGVLASLMSHSSTDKIRAALAELEAVPDGELERLALGLLRAVRSLAEMNRPVWRNIF